MHGRFGPFPAPEFSIHENISFGNSTREVLALASFAIVAIVGYLLRRSRTRPKNRTLNTKDYEVIDEYARYESREKYLKA